MNKLGVVLGVAAVVTLSGCLDPNYKKPGSKVQAEVKPAPVEQTQPVEVTPDVHPVQQTEIEIATTEKKCSCAPGTKHAEPCSCGAVDCLCVVEKPVVVVPAPVVAEPSTTTYIVQRGDYLAKISKKYNIKLDALRAANPQLKNDVVKVGQKINLPGKVEVGEQTVPAGAFATTPKKEYKPFDGATKEYVVKSGDTLGGIAYGNGINIRQLKELNGLTDNTIRVGQKLKIPASKVAAAPAVTKAEPVKVASAPVAKKVAAKVDTKPVVKDEVKEAPAVPADVAAEPAKVEPPVADAPAPVPAAVEEGVTHVVQEGEDITGLSIRFSLSPAEIRELNNLGPNDELKPGQVLKLPADTQL